MMEYLERNYHTFFNLKNRRTFELIRTWWRDLKNYDADIMWEVLREYTASSQYAPQLVNLETAYNQKVTAIENATKEKATLIRALIDDSTGVNETERLKYNLLLTNKLDSIPLKNREAFTERLYLRCRKSSSALMQDITILNDILGEME